VVEAKLRKVWGRCPPQRPPPSHGMTGRGLRTDNSLTATATPEPQRQTTYRGRHRTVRPRVRARTVTVCARNPTSMRTHLPLGPRTHTHAVCARNHPSHARKPPLVCAGTHPWRLRTQPPQSRTQTTPRLCRHTHGVCARNPRIHAPPHTHSRTHPPTPFPLRAFWYKSCGSRCPGHAVRVNKSTRQPGRRERERERGGGRMGSGR